MRLTVDIGFLNMFRMRHIKLPIPIRSILLLMAFGCSSSFGTTTALQSWQNLVSDADFVGVIECSVAGGVVARYQVMDSWKGAANGEELTLGIPADPHGPRFPTVLCGQRFVAVAFRDNGLLYPGTTLPLWWRRLPADYAASHVQGMAAIKKGRFRQGLNPFTMDTTPLELFKRKVADFLSKSAEEQERIRLLEGGILRRPSISESGKGIDPSKDAHFESIRASLSAKDVALGILQLAPQMDERDRYRLLDTLSDGGLATLAVLNSLDVNAWPWQKHDLDRTKTSIKIRTGLLPRPTFDRFREEIPTPEQIEKAREELFKKSGQVPWSAVAILSKADPARVVKMLLEWRPLDPAMLASDTGYHLGSQFCYLCGNDRETHFTALSNAQDPWIRTAAAVYLCFENPVLGKDKLKECCVLDGGPGSWAALVLASRGDKSAVLRALELYKIPGNGIMASHDRNDMQKRMSVLLSNSARHSGLQPPAILDEAPGSDAPEATHLNYFEEIKKWWKDNSDQIVLFDPWLTALDKQKVD